MESKKKEREIKEPIAIIGMGCLFPRAQGTKAYWRLIVNGEDGITEVPETHWSAGDYYDADQKRQDHTYCTRGGFLSPVSFDPTEFGIPPTSLEATDTSQILSLVVAKMALEDAGYGNGKGFDRKRTSVILGATGTQEMGIKLGSRLGHPIWRKALKEAGLSDAKTDEIVERISERYVPWQENSFPGLLGNVIAGRICNRLDLGGTNCVVDAACASSMSAINLAAMDLTAGRSDMVITGGVDTLNDIFMHMCFAKTYVLSETGDIRPFSEKADGTILGEGIGMLVLKRLSDAERAADRIYAVIKSVGSSSDGKSQGIYAPLAAGQAQALRMAYRDANIDPATIELIEAHGTGTRVGDAVEFTALKEVFGDSIQNGNRCAIGTVKSMIGHAKAAAGAAGIIKAILALHHKVIPPTLKVDKPDPELGIEKSPFHISQTSRPWPATNKHPRRSGVSAFGFGGSNFHVVLEEYQPSKTDNAWDGTVEIVAFSDASIDGLIHKIDDLLKITEEETPLDQTVFALMQLRNNFKPDDPLRLLLVWENPKSNTTGLKALLNETKTALKQNSRQQPRQTKNIYFGTAGPKGKLAFMFPGQGSQYLYMGKDLLCLSAAAQNSFDRINTQFEAEYQKQLGDFIYPNSEKEKETSLAAQLTATDIAQPAIGAVSLGMLKLMEAFNVKPDAVCGHSFGELTALYAGGRIDEDTFGRLAILRGKFMAGKGRDNGTMLAVKAPLNELEKLVKEKMDGVVPANRNSYDQGVLSGPSDAIQKAEEICRQAGFRTTRLDVAAAFHSNLVEHAVKPFKQALRSIQIKPSDIPVYANTLGKPYPSDTEAVKELLGNQLLNPINFVGQIEDMVQAGVDTFVEIGPRSVLSGLTQSMVKNQNADVITLDKSNGRRSGILDLARVLCRLAAKGYFVDLSQWENNNPEPQKQRMVVPVTGANFKPKNKPRKSGTPLKEETTTSRTATPTPPLKTEKAAEVGPGTPINERPPINSNMHKELNATHINKRANTMETHHLKQSNIINEALRVVQEGLKSMQTIQTQTAETHRKFLETQTQAGKTLQAMILDTQRLANTAIFGIPADMTGPIESEVNLQKGADAAPNPIPQPSLQPVVATVETKPEIQKPIPAPEVQTRVQETKMDMKAIESIMLSVVSELTGYPENMLGLDMDIEADLGIDSIKRVEILSNFEERMPDMPQISPDIMGRLKTLREIADYIAKADNSKAEQVSQPDPTVPVSETTNPATTAKPNGNSAIETDAQAIETALMETVSELTGYPADMLGLEMDIEADLGIDSIKRVEILSAFEERMPNQPSVSPEVMSTLKTIGQIRDYLLKEATAAKPSRPAQKTPDAGSVSPTPSNSHAEIEANLLEVVSELTGYPMDMLAADMDIEADLGIDSIKRVEILSAFEEKMPGLPPVSPDVMSTLKTLGQICDYLVETNQDALEATKPEPSAQANPAQNAHTEIEAILLEVVSELTGYPLDMLAADMDIEADLGIDSIKRVEILSAFEEKMPNLPPVSPDVVSTLKTLGQISTYLSGTENAAKADSHQMPAQPRTDEKTETAQADQVGETAKNVTRYEIKPVAKLYEAGVKVGIPFGRKVYIAAEANPLTDYLAEILSSNQIEAEIIPCQLDPLDSRDITDAGGLIIISPFPQPEPNVDPFDPEINQFLKQSFQLANAFAEPLIASGKSGGAIFGTVSCLDGQFGFSHKTIHSPMTGGLAGLAKTASTEWEEVCCHAIDIACDRKPDIDLATAVINDLMQFGPVEIGLSYNSRMVLELTDAPYPQGTTGLEPNDVVVISGGGRGVTAACAKALAEQVKPFIALLGRSPLPASEPDWLQNLTDASEIKKAILENEFKGQKVTPAQVETIFKKHMANREIMTNLEEIRQAGAKVEYYSIDVRDEAAVSRLFADIRTQHGPVKAIIHGAGVLEDRFILQKSMEQFEKVFNTKVDGYKALLHAAQNDPLRHIVLFSSIAARFGNKGQVDYAMANEVLNKTAQYESGRRPDCRVSAINWGPWDGGMVTSALKKEFQRNNIELVPVAEGAACMVHEMCGGPGKAVEVVIGAEISSQTDQAQTHVQVSDQRQEHPHLNDKTPPKALILSHNDLSITLSSDVNVKHFPILEAHKLNGRPVVPFALMAEWFGHGALHGNPGLQLLGLDDMRLLSGIKLDDEMKKINLMAGKAHKNGSGYEVLVEIRNNGQNGDGIIHSKATAILATDIPVSPVFDRVNLLSTNGYNRSASEIYAKILFHGKDLHGIQSVQSCNEQGIVAKLNTAPPPQNWLSDPPRSKWIADPLVLDSAFQMASLWCYEQTGVVSLPSYGAEYRQYVRTFPQGEITCVLEVKSVSDHKMTGDFTFIDQNLLVMATLKGYEAVMDKALNKAFKPQGINL